MFIFGFTFGSWASRIPDIKLALGLSDAALGMVLFACPFAQLPTMALAPVLVKRFGSRPVILTTMVLYPTALLALGTAPTFALLFAAMLMFGVCNCLLNICNTTQAVAVEKLYARSIMNKFHGCWSLGGVAGGLLGGAAASALLTPQVHFSLIWVIAVVSAIAASFWLMRVDPVHKPHEKACKTDGKKRRFTLPDAFLIMLGVVGLGCMATESTMYDWNSVYFVTVLGESGFQARWGYLAAMVAMVVARFIADSLVNRFGEVFVLRSSAFFMTAGLAVFALFPSVAAVTLGSALVGFGMAAVVPICYSMAGRSRLMRPSAAISLISAISFLGFLIGPPLIGAISQAFDLRTAFAVMTVCPLIVLVLSAPLGRLFDQRRG